MAGESPTRSYFHSAPMTALTVQKQSQRRFSGLDAPLAAAWIRTKRDAGKNFFEQLDGRYIDHFDTQDERTAELSNSQFKLVRTKNVVAMQWPLRRQPQAFFVTSDLQMIGTSLTRTWECDPLQARQTTPRNQTDELSVTDRTDTAENFTAKKYTVRTYTSNKTHKLNLSEWHDITGCLTRSAAFLVPENPDVLFQKVDSPTLNFTFLPACHHVTPGLSSHDTPGVPTSRAVWNNLTSSISTTACSPRTGDIE